MTLASRKPYTPTADEIAKSSVPLSDADHNGRKIVPGIEVTLLRAPGRRPGRYEVQRIEREASGKTVLTVVGPLRVRAESRWHYINLDAVAVVHVKTRRNRG